jgi:hypothetical protein
MDYFHSLLNSGLDYLMVVIDPDEEQSWEAIRDSLNEDIFVTVHVTINDRNKARISKILERIHLLGVKSISLSAVSKDFSPELVSARQLVAEMGIFLVYDLPVPYSAINPVGLEMEANEASKEGAGHTWLYVEPDGDVLLGQGSSKCVGNFLTDPWVTISGNIKLETVK